MVYDWSVSKCEDNDITDEAGAGVQGRQRQGPADGHALRELPVDREHALDGTSRTPAPRP